MTAPEEIRPLHTLRFARSGVALPLVALLSWLPAGCADEDPTAEIPEEGTELGDEDMPLGDLGADDAKADGVWGAATTCKAIPDLPRLQSPRITISLDGLTLRLTDTISGYDKVFPIGPGAQDTKDTSITYGESLSYFPIIRYGKQDFEIRPATTTPCKIWYTDSATGQRLPVFAGLPFLSWSGNYAIHGPVDNYRAANGGNLRRGYVSHGCIRMEAADVLELYARVRGVARVPVHVQREPERLADGTRVDVPAADRWFGSECDADADCGFVGGFCQPNPYGGRGYCTQTCTRTCPDKAGYPVSFCVADPQQPSRGICVLKEQPYNLGCRTSDHMTPRTATRFSQAGVSARVCLPGTHGWIGDRCQADAECTLGTTCNGEEPGQPGICTQACQRYCPDLPGYAWTFCADEPALGGGTCLRQCTPGANAAECPADHDCVARARLGQPGTVRNVCLPR